jgi:hypothetical protein
MFPAFRFPDLGRFARHHPLPRSTPKNKDLAVSTPGLTSGFPRFPDVPHHQILKGALRAPHPHPAISIDLLQTKDLA